MKGYDSIIDKKIKKIEDENQQIIERNLERKLFITRLSIETNILG